jgi:hypothetical protein
MRKLNRRKVSSRQVNWWQMSKRKTSRQISRRKVK